MCPLVTIGLPIYNAEATLDRAVRSIIGQGFSDWKLLLIDDGSADSSPAIAQRYRDSRIAVLSDGVNRGISARLNQAVAMTEGRYFCRMDADDIAFPDRLARQVAFLEHHPQVDLAASSIVLFRDDGTLQGVIPAPVSHGEICRSPWQGFHFFHPTWMGKTEWFRTHPYESHADGVEDQLLLYGSFRQSVFAGIPDVLLGYRENRRSFRKILYRRRLFWRKIAAQAIARGRWRDALLLSLILPLKIAADFINTELGVDQLRTRMNSVDRSVETSWHILWRNLGQPVERNSR
jgi:glycosyltransferase involved in cell wall biosynthesis